MDTSYPFLTRFEQARVLAERAEQLSQGAPPQVDVGADDDAATIAIRELLAYKISMGVRRQLPDGSFIDIPLRDLLPDADGFLKISLPSK